MHGFESLGVLEGHSLAVRDVVADRHVWLSSIANSR